MSKITGKIMPVPDEVCEGCAQLWQGECRAFNIAHSSEEYAARAKFPVAVCLRKGEKETCGVQTAIGL